MGVGALLSASERPVDDEKVLPNHHLPSGTPENLDDGCVADAVQLIAAVASELAGGQVPPGQGRR